MESYAHKAAKSVVTGWFRTARDVNQWQWVRCLGYWCCPTRDKADFGIWEEYPILPNHVGLRPTWDRFTFQNRQTETSEFRSFPPTYEELAGLGHTPAAIIDIAVQHKNKIALGIEIVYKHPITKTKMEFLRAAPLGGLLVLPAEWILDQIKIPENAPDQFWVWS